MKYSKKLKEQSNREQIVAEKRKQYRPLYSRLSDWQLLLD